MSTYISGEPASFPDGGRLRFPLPAVGFIAAALIVAVIPFASGLSKLYDIWNLQPEYSHGIVIPAISLFLIWQQRHWLERTAFKGSWSGLVLVAGGLLFWFVGEMSTLYSIVQYGFLLVLYGLVLTLTGWAVFKRLWMPLLILIFMVPLPAFFSNTLSLKMQLLSSSLGVWLIRLAGISVYLEGNVIDLGTYKLQVAEACDGLRYMFPLMTLAFIVSYFFRAVFWKRAVLFLSSIPIAILMNSFRIGVIGITVEYWGAKMAEGTLHDFEGWVVFMLSTAALIVVAAVLTRIGRQKISWREAMAIDFGQPVREPATTARRSIPAAFFAATALLTSATVLACTLPERAEMRPARSAFVEFPTTVEGWQGQREPMESIYIDKLHLDDYVFVNYQRANQLPINLYVAYYDSQRKGESAHSPRSCLPGGGWTIRSLERRELQDVGANGAILPVNRVVIEHGSQRQIVYYWFQQRGRLLTNEYLVKWYIFWDALTRNRTDGALVRLIVPVLPGADESQLDRELTQFAAASAPLLRRYIPD